ncbi:LysR family transcriptional regulator [Breoghania sp.]|uniref:LysR family transcriptional regulator n=1 Tax=Breoghania sp. TaxID=2065378 RepID=UPI002AA8C7E0|nr:LysR family transcriptional regulator [Breoghania sp.]
MNLREMELFGTLMRVGTTTETARVLGISQPGVSAQLKRLESRLGICLFQRTGNRLEPTAEALEIYEQAAPIFTAQAKIRSRLPSMRNRFAEPAVIAATPILVEWFLGPILVEAGYGDWKKSLEIRIHDPVEDLRSRVADIGLQMAVPPKVEFHAHAVGRSALVAVMRNEHELAAREQLSCADIAPHPLVCYDADWSPMGASIRDAFRAAGHSYAPSCTVPYCANVCALVLSCGGIGIVDEMTARSYERASIAWRPVGDIPDISIIAFHRRHEPLRSVTQDLLNRILAVSETAG